MSSSSRAEKCLCYLSRILRCWWCRTETLKRLKSLDHQLIRIFRLKIIQTIQLLVLHNVKDIYLEMQWYLTDHRWSISAACWLCCKRGGGWATSWCGSPSPGRSCPAARSPGPAPRPARRPGCPAGRRKLPETQFGGNFPWFNDDFMGIPQNQRSFESCARNPVKIIVFICYILSGSTSRVQGYRFHYVLYSFEPGIPSLHCQNLLSENSFAKTSGRQC